MSKLAIEVRGYFIEQVIGNGDNSAAGIKEILSNPETLAQVNALCEIAATVEEGVTIPQGQRRAFFLNRIAGLTA
ncbi:hypothetical protein [Paenibacillus sp. FSL K6-2859]|uniref:hypothetical protein n=1 Tax=Paenibacillus sp. FSL K6-2859 TaxID=2921482 RepID=UPI0030FB5DCD